MSCWEESTVSINMTANTITGRLDSLSPVVPAVVNDGTFGPIYFTSNPLGKIIDVKSGALGASGNSAITVSANAGNIHGGDQIKITNTIKNLQRKLQQYDYIIVHH